MKQEQQYFFVFDVESIGIHGQPFAVGGVVIDRDGKEHSSFEYYYDSEFAQGDEDDRAWVRDCVTVGGEELAGDMCLIDAFWDVWQDAKNQFPGIVMAAECAWPVEARFLMMCVQGDLENRKWKGPYPLHDIASIMFAKGMDPMATYERLPNELPAHSALADARQSARLLIQALNS